jgi:hypothetical protein
MYVKTKGLPDQVVAQRQVFGFGGFGLVTGWNESPTPRICGGSRLEWEARNHKQGYHG